eukprot:365469-Chlamydomonas_euryale.AAC.1
MELAGTAAAAGGKKSGGTGLQTRTSRCGGENMYRLPSRCGGEHTDGLSSRQVRAGFHRKAGQAFIVRQGAPSRGREGASVRQRAVIALIASTRRRFNAVKANSRAESWPGIDRAPANGSQ